MALHDKLPIPPIVSLRRAGDIIGLLPLLRHLSQRQNPIKLVVHRAFASILDGVSYAEPIIWDGDMDDPVTATREHKALNAQVHGVGLMPVAQRKVNFAKAAWNQLGYEWNRHIPLAFDKRDPKREKKLAKAHLKTDLPKILVKLQSFSSPFPDAERIKQNIQNEFGGFAEIVDLDTVNGERLYDLLGLLDRAACLVSADTVTLWLAKATKCPVVAFVNPNPFLASPPTGNVIARANYAESKTQWDKLASAVHSTLFDAGGDGVALVFNDYTSTDVETQNRERLARETWPWLRAELVLFKPEKRSSKNLGDARGTPFIKDMVDTAISRTTENIIAICNNDIHFDKALRWEVEQSCKEFGCYWAYRIEKPNGSTDRGADFFAFTRQWWNIHRHLVPDILLGYPWWDNIALRVMRWSGCSERKRLYYHVPHPGVQTRPVTPGWKYNDTLALAWLKEHHELMQQP